MGPVELLVVRHGESMGNVAAAAATAAGAEVIQVGQRDADVPLSPVGVAQAQAFGQWLRDLPDDAAPQSVWCSPYQRAQQTALTAIQVSGRDLPIRIDERVRDRELGILDLLTTAGVVAKYPDEAARRQWLGKFYHRPPGGESWADVALRVRTFLRDLDAEEDGTRVLVVAHDALVLIFRYICERLTEPDILNIALADPVANASATRLVRPSGTGLWTLGEYNMSAHVAAYGAPVTVHPGDGAVLPQSAR
jgi:glucosyl-3-phosphoglycerate phosphatase